MNRSQTYTAVIERCPVAGDYVGRVPGFPGAHSQAQTIQELRENLKEVITMLLEDGNPELTSKYVGACRIVVEARTSA